MLYLAELADLPRHNTSMVRNKWGDIVRQVHQTGSVAITLLRTADRIAGGICAL